MYMWDFGDGTPQETVGSPTISHTFANPGTFGVTCSVIDAQSNVVKTTVQIGINPPSSVQPLQQGVFVIIWYYQGIPAYEAGNIYGSAVIANKRKDIVAIVLVKVQVFVDSTGGNVVQVGNQMMSEQPGSQQYMPIAYTVAHPGDLYAIMVKAFDQNGNDIGDVDLTMQVQT